MDAPMMKQVKMRSAAEIQARIDELERVYDEYVGMVLRPDDPRIERNACIAREIAVLRWVLGGDGMIRKPRI